MKQERIRKCICIIFFFLGSTFSVRSVEPELDDFIVHLDMLDDMECEVYDSIEVAREQTHLPGNGIIEEYGGKLLMGVITCQEYVQNKWSRLMAWWYGKKIKVKKRYAR